MSKIPKILQVSGVLYNHTEYPVGSIERAKALFAEMWHSSQLTETVISSWDDAKRRILEERAWEKLGREKPEDVFREIFGEKYELVELGKVHISKDATIQEAEAKGRSRLAAEMVLAEGITQAEAAERVGISQQAVSKAMNTTEMSHCDIQVVIPSHISGNRNSEADFRKLSPEGQERVRQGEPLNCRRILRQFHLPTKTPASIPARG